MIMIVKKNKTNNNSLETKNQNRIIQKPDADNHFQNPWQTINDTSGMIKPLLGLLCGVTVLADVAAADPFSRVCRNNE